MRYGLDTSTISAISVPVQKGKSPKRKINNSEPVNFNPVRALSMPFRKMTFSNCARFYFTKCVKFNLYARPKPTFSKMWPSGTPCAGYFNPKRRPFWVKFGEIKLPKATCNFHGIPLRPITKRKYPCGYTPVQPIISRQTLVVS